MALRQARILSSEIDSTIKQEQNTNVNIKISKPQERLSTVPLYPNVQPLNQKVNFTQQPSQHGIQQTGQGLHSQMTPKSSVYPSAATINNLCQEAAALESTAQERGIADLGTEINDLEKKNSFLEMLVEMYENNPLKVNSYDVFQSKLIMDMVKLLIDCDKVDFVIDDSDVGC